MPSSTVKAYAITRVSLSYRGFMRVWTHRKGDSSIPCQNQPRSGAMVRVSEQSDGAALHAASANRYACA